MQIVLGGEADGVVDVVVVDVVVVDVVVVDVVVVDVVVVDVVVVDELLVLEADLGGAIIPFQAITWPAAVR